MQKAAQLMAELANFDEKYPDASLEDFCSYYLLRQREKSTPQRTSLPAADHTSDFVLMRLVNRIVKLHAIYAAKATEGTGINSSHEFSLLNAIDCTEPPRKTEAIYTSLFELSTGIDMVNRLKKAGLVAEFADEKDKRSRRLKITKKGYSALAVCRSRMNQLAEMEFHDLSEDEKKICIRLLSVVDSKFSGLWQEHKGKGFEEIYKEVVE